MYNYVNYDIGLLNTQSVTFFFSDHTAYVRRLCTHS